MRRIKRKIKKRKKEGEKKETKFINLMRHFKRSIANHLVSKKYVKVKQ